MGRRRRRRRRRRGFGGFLKKLQSLHVKSHKKLLPQITKKLHKQLQSKQQQSSLLEHMLRVNVLKQEAALELSHKL